MASAQILHGFMESPLERQSQGLCLTRSCLVGSLGGSIGLMSGHKREIQDRSVFTSVSDCTSQNSKRVFLIVSVVNLMFPHVPHMRSHIETCVFQHPRS